MATLESDVFDIFMMLQTDYRLTSIYQNSGSAALNTYLESWLMLSIDDFDICTQSLAFTPTSGSVEGYFSEDLTQKHKNILAQLITKYWMQKEVQDILNMSNVIQDHDFKQYSQAQNLKAKMDYYNSKKEELSQLLQDYAYKNNSWSNWRSGIYWS